MLVRDVERVSRDETNPYVITTFIGIIILYLLSTVYLENFNNDISSNPKRNLLKSYKMIGLPKKLV